VSKLSKKALSELDAAIDQLGGGVAPILPPVKPAGPAARTKRRAARPVAKKKGAARRNASPKRKTGAKKR
jgi:hypothetical protein